MPCTLWDERYSSNKARRLHQTLAGRSQADRKSNSTSLNAKDSVEAAIILQVISIVLNEFVNFLMNVLLRIL